MLTKLIILFAALFILVASRRTKIAQAGRCGPQYGGQKCPPGECCSKWSWCGGDRPWCGTGCQEGYGSCYTKNGRCGSDYGNQKCIGTSCCSQFSWCGTSEPWCGYGCQKGYGTCSNSEAEMETLGPNGELPGQYYQENVKADLTNDVEESELGPNGELPGKYHQMVF